MEDEVFSGAWMCGLTSKMTEPSVVEILDDPLFTVRLVKSDVNEARDLMSLSVASFLLSEDMKINLGYGLMVGNRKRPQSWLVGRTKECSKLSTGE